MVLTAIFTFDSEMAFPGYAAILPVLGAALVIAYGQDTAVDRLLSWKPFVFIGLISYSLYLWHWPIIVFGTKAGHGELGFGTATAYVLASILAGYLSWRFVENPFRDRAKVTRRQVFAGAGIGATSLMAVAAFALSVDLGDRTFSRQTLAFDAARDDVSPHRDRCHSLSGVAPPETACVLGDGPAQLVLWADSHGVEMAYALFEEGLVVRSLTYSSCPPGIYNNLDQAPDCAQHNQAVIDYLLDQEQARNILMAAYYPPVNKYPSNVAHMRATVKKLIAAGYKVYVLAPTPHENDDHVDLPRQLLRGGNVQLSLEGYESEHQDAIRLLAKLEQDGATVLWPADLLCSGGNCPAVLKGKPVLFDSHHLSMSAARYLAHRYAPFWRSSDKSAKGNLHTIR